MLAWKDDNMVSHDIPSYWLVPVLQNPQGKSSIVVLAIYVRETVDRLLSVMLFLRHELNHMTS